jgi:hypothetical protein
MFIKIKEGYKIKKIGQDAVALFLGADTVDLRRGIILNPVAELLFEAPPFLCPKTRKDVTK